MAEMRQHNLQERERKFQQGLQRISKDNPDMAQGNAILDAYDMQQERKRDEIFDKWENQVYRRVEHQLLKYMSKAPGSEGLRSELRPSDDPMKVDLRIKAQEDNFHRAAQAILHAHPSKDELQERMMAEKALVNRSHVRPMLPIHLWEQNQYYATPYGKFPQACCNQVEFGTFHSGRLMGNAAHRMPIDESDGVPAAGKGKTKYERNTLGILKGDVAKGGESSQYKNGHGGGTAAPCQDHYHYERGTSVVDREYPLGKRAYPGLMV